MKPGEDWLRAINEKFRREDVPPKARPMLAILEYSKQFNCSWISPSDIDRFGYGIAQFIATTFTRMFSDRDSRNKILSGNLGNVTY